MFKLFALLPIVSMSLLAVNFSRQGLCWRSALLSAAVAWGVMVTTITEVLSILHLLNFEWLSFAWILTIILLSCIYFYADRKNAAEYKYLFTRFTNLLLCCIIGIILITGITAFIAPPNNWDSMTYHMSRVMHWMQNLSVVHYPTNIQRQIELSPWAEFAITHFQILSGSDYLANLVQWFCMVGSILGVTLIAEKFGVDHRGQMIAAFFAATIPMGILQSSSTQNDCVVSFWLICLVYFGIKFNEKPCWSYASAVGASLGLSILTKGTAYLYALPFMIWFAIFSFKSIKLKAAKYIVLISLIALSLNFGHFIRNYEIFGNMLNSGEQKYSNDSYGMASLISNSIRNIALEMSSSSEHLNRAIKAGACLLHRSLGLDINDHRTTWPGAEFNLNGSRHEDLAGNPLQLVLISFSFIAICCSKKFKHRQNVLPYLSALVIAFMFFCLYLRWQPWHNRLLLPLIILWSPIVALVMAEIKFIWATKAMLAALIVMAVPFSLKNVSRPLITDGVTRSILITDRTSQYFNNRPDLRQKYYEIARHLKNINCSNVAIKIGVDTWEYPLWVLLQEEFKQNIHIEHVKVNNKSGKIPLKNFNYCAMVSIRNGDQISIKEIPLLIETPL